MHKIFWRTISKWKQLEKNNYCNINSKKNIYHAETKHDESEKKKKKGDVTLRNPYKRRQMDSV